MMERVEPLVNVLFIRGLTRESRHWRGLDKKFEQSHPGKIKVHSIDLPGVGVFNKETSPTNLDDYVFFLRKKMDLSRPFVCIGISMGGMIALRWAQLFPQEIKKIFVINSSAGNLSSSRERFSLNYGDIKKLIGVMLTDDYHLKEERILKLTTAQFRIDKTIIDEFADFQKTHPIGFRSSINQLWAAASFKIEAPLENTPVVVISGLADRLVHPSCSQKLSQVLNAKLITHPHAGHDLPLDDPDWLLEVFWSELRL